MVFFRLLCKLPAEELLEDLNCCVFDNFHDRPELLEQVTPAHAKCYDIVDAQQVCLPGLFEQRVVEVAYHLEEVIREQYDGEH